MEATRNLLEVKLEEVDPEIDTLIREEMQRNEETINLIASENYPPKSAMKAIGSMLSGIYSEGYPGERYYRGLENIDKIESLARERAKAVFGADHANVQAHSGSGANIAAYLSLLSIGDRILSMNLDAGGHLSHGAKVSIVSKLFDIHQYGVNQETGLMDYDQIRALALELKPKLIVCGASAYPRIIDFARFGAIAKEAGAYLLADMAHIAGMVATGDHPSPVPHCDIVTTTTHKTLRMTRGSLILCKKEHAAKVDRAVFPLMQGGPHQANIAAIAVGLKHLTTPEYKAYIKQVLANAKLLASELQGLGFPIASGGTDNHLMLVDLYPQGIDGDTASIILEEAGIVVNKNRVPGDKGTPKKPYGIRLGTPAMTSRGMGLDEVKQVARWIAEVLRNPQDEAVRKRVKTEIADLGKRFPIYLPGYF
ncbi:MAG: serine hydroxymethyltransferase [Deltaproteobacteria bacterium]|nr:serine hydroxymethyltransferase [Deltaproteobacteria bacterium]